jgi:hypothetical protein
MNPNDSLDLLRATETACDISKPALHYVRSIVLTALARKITALWDVTQ